MFLKTQASKISLIGGAILVAITLIAGVCVFLIMQRQTEDILDTSLKLFLKNHVHEFERLIGDGISDVTLVTTRPFLIQQLQNLAVEPNNIATHQALEEIARSFSPLQFSAISLYDQSGREVAHVGSFAQQPQLTVPLKTSHKSELLWNHGMVLRTQADIVHGGQRIGRVMTERFLPTLTTMFAEAEARALGRSGELAVCAPLAADMQCFPSALNPAVFKSQPVNVDGKPLPMSYALRGLSGIIYARDYRKQDVAAAYSPIGALGLGMVLKIDTAELYQPVREQFYYILPLLILAVLIGGFLLRWQVAPLVHKLVRSEQEARTANLRLQDSETRGRAVVDSINEGIVVINDRGIIESFNPAAERIFGCRATEAIGSNVALLMPEPYGSEHDGYINNYLNTGHAVVIGVEREVTGLRKDGSCFPMDLRVSEMRLDDRRMFIGTVRDITERKEAEQRILHLATHDVLTSLPNRALLHDRINQAIAQAHRSGSCIAVIFIDLDKFKVVNDSLGHDTGDLLLQAVATKLSMNLREVDTVARQGGDEFIIVVPGLGHPEEAAVIAQKLLASLSEPFMVKTYELHTGASIGISIYPHDGEDVATLMKNSDTAMYHAKENGRNNYQFFAAHMNAMAAERLSLETNLRHALERDEFLLYYQPIVLCGSGDVVGVEALLRWQQPELGWVSPTKFIPVAEDTGLIGPLGEWVFKTACLQVKAWLDAGYASPRVAINLSTRQFRQGDLIQVIAKIISETGIEARHIEVEITESLLMERADEAAGKLKALSDMGIRISIDDFGTGYSSLSYLKRFPIDKLKIDQSFVRDVATDPDDAAIVVAIIAMAHSLGMKVVAEGVETAEQLAFLRQHGCDECQGYYFSRPLPALDVAEKLPKLA